MSITENEITHALSVWRKYVLEIAETYDAEGLEKARPIAEKLLDEEYYFEYGPVLFKPTMASGDQTFRPSRKGALAYFVGHDDEFPNDTGFALRGWRKCRMYNVGTFVENDMAVWMGQAQFTDKNGDITIADKSFGYKKDANGNLRIILHHSSLPFQP